MLELPPEVLFRKLEPRLHKKMLFIENWVQPHGFLWWTTPERMKYREQLRQVLFSKSLQKHHNGVNYPVRYPTPKNAWVWFGNYGGVHTYANGDRAPRVGFYETLPRINGRSVRRIVFNAIMEHFSPSPLAADARLAPIPGTCQSDVSFYKHFPGMRRWGLYNYQEKLNFYLDLGIDVKLARMNTNSTNPRPGSAPVTASGYEDFKAAIKEICPDSNTMKKIGYEMVEKMLREVKHINNPAAIRKAFDALAEQGYEDEMGGGEYYGDEPY